jgi:hypothetical protein
LELEARNKECERTSKHRIASHHITSIMRIIFRVVMEWSEVPLLVDVDDGSRSYRNLILETVLGRLSGRAPSRPFFSLNSRHKPQNDRICTMSRPPFLFQLPYAPPRSCHCSNDLEREHAPASLRFSHPPSLFQSLPLSRSRSTSSTVSLHLLAPTHIPIPIPALPTAAPRQISTPQPLAP